MASGERVDFALDGVAAPEVWAAATDNERQGLVLTADPGLADPLLFLRVEVTNQLVADDPAHVWATAERLLGGGLDTDAVWQQLMVAFARVQETEPTAPYDWDQAAYREILDRLPFPAFAEVQQKLLDKVAAALIMGTPQLLADTIEDLGYEPDDEVAADLVEAAYDAVMSEAGELAAVVAPSGDGDVTMHVPPYVDGIVLTHELTADERESDVLVLSFDLAGFERIADPVLVGAAAAGDGGAAEQDVEEVGDGVALETVADETGLLIGWQGPEGWLDRFPDTPGSVLAVRHVGEGQVAIEVVPAPSVDDELVADLGELYADSSAASLMPVTGEELVLGWLLRNGKVFAEPLAPLGQMCEAAGLLRWRESAVAHDLEQGVNERMAGHLAAVLPGAADEELALTTLAVLDLAERLSLDLDAEPERIGNALDELGDPDNATVLVTVTDQYFHGARTPDEAGAWAEALVEAAEGSNQVAVARYMAALAAEAGGQLGVAEQHLELAVESDDGFVPALDRLAWFASDRGDAAKAVALWQRCPAPVVVAIDLEVVGPYAEAAATNGADGDAGAAAGGAVPLADRVVWLFTKAADYLARGPAEARREMMELAEARGYDPDDPQMLLQAYADPLLVDVLLMEGGWLQRFVDDRGPLLPADEAGLAAEWLSYPRSVHEVTNAVEGAGLGVRECRFNDEFSLDDPQLVDQVEVGDMLCGRAVPDGDDGLMLVGGTVRFPASEEEEVLALLDTGDPYAALSLFGPVA